MLNNDDGRMNRIVYRLNFLLANIRFIEREYIYRTVANIIEVPVISLVAFIQSHFTGLSVISS